MSVLSFVKVFKGFARRNDQEDGEDGFTLVETILAVVIGFAIAALAGKAIKSGWDSYRVSRLVNQVTEIQTAMSKAADVNGSYISIDKIDKLVSDFNLSPDVKKSPYGQDVKVTGSAYGYVIEFPASPKNACQQALKRFPVDITGSTACTGATSNIVLTFNSDA
ncbi:type II secretion system protein [Aeromonas veronii]